MGTGAGSGFFNPYGHTTTKRLKIVAWLKITAVNSGLTRGNYSVGCNTRRDRAEATFLHCPISKDIFKVGAQTPYCRIAAPTLTARPTRNG